MKASAFLTLALAALVGSTVSAKSLIQGPYLSKTVGNRTCTILPNSVTILEGKSKTVKQVELNREELEAAILGAQKAPLKTVALHMMATNPPVEVVAGVFPNVQMFTIYRDASDIKARSNNDARDLLKQVAALCK